VLVYVSGLGLVPVYVSVLVPVSGLGLGLDPSPSSPMDVRLSVRVADLTAWNDLRERIAATAGILSAAAVPVLRPHLDGPM